jgi:hypothetical protein
MEIMNISGHLIGMTELVIWLLAQVPDGIAIWDERDR